MAVPAINCRQVVESTLPLATKIALGQATIDKLPGQHLCLSALTQIPVRLQTAVGESLLPFSKIKMLASTVETAPQLNCPLQNCGQTPIPTGEDPFQQRHLGIMIFEL